ncbi:hypothetical protein BDN70DRAFT_908635 [Pholiota conissans]|uniref:HNH nuclease domain-containing protein n=1 Tax=Pholiota conissans TaxID=109636 RepID=A0A9P6CVG1_9AGAR|nr:hypothetical protein BDN70DRAFT_908635 [Pholiota conissans]
MAPLPPFPLPLPSNRPPSGFGWEECDMSVISTTTACNVDIDKRDTLLGRPRCVICELNVTILLRQCHIIKNSEPEIWSNLKARGWIPSHAKAHPRHEPPNGLLMSSHRHILFDAYAFFNTFPPRCEKQIQKFVLINYSNEPILQQFHGKAIALDVKARRASFTPLFILHEMLVHGFHPFESIEPSMPDDYPWQDWILSCSITPNEDYDNNISVQSLPQFQPTTMSTGNTSVGHRLALNEDVSADILTATRESPSWKACQVEDTSWPGTAEENIEKYVSSIGKPDL